MPDERPTTLRKMLLQRELLEMIPVSRTTIWKWCAEGLFPKPVKLNSNRVAWFADEIIEWQEAVGKTRRDNP